MKNTLLALLAGLFLFSCSEDKIKTYDGADFIYFAPHVGLNATVYWDTTSVFSFASYPTVTDTVIRVAVRTGGMVRNYDRYFKARITGGTAVEGVHYEAFSDADLVIKANSINGFIPLRVFMQNELLEDVVDLQLELLPSDDFTLNFTYKYGRERSRLEDTINMLAHTQFLTAAIPKPANWPDPLLGYYSVNKLYEFNRVNNWTMETWERTGGLTATIRVACDQFIMHLRTYMDMGPEAAIRDPKSDAASRGYMTTPELIGLVEDWPNLLPQ